MTSKETKILAKMKIYLNQKEKPSQEERKQFKEYFYQYWHLFDPSFLKHNYFRIRYIGDIDLFILFKSIKEYIKAKGKEKLKEREVKNAYLLFSYSWEEYDEYINKDRSINIEDEFMKFLFENCTLPKDLIKIFLIYFYHFAKGKTEVWYMLKNYKIPIKKLKNEIFYSDDRPNNINYKLNLYFLYGLIEYQSFIKKYPKIIYDCIDFYYLPPEYFCMIDWYKATKVKNPEDKWIINKDVIHFLLDEEKEKHTLFPKIVESIPDKTDLDKTPFWIPKDVDKRYKIMQKAQFDDVETNHLFKNIYQFILYTILKNYSFEEEPELLEEIKNSNLFDDFLANVIK